MGKQLKWAGLLGGAVLLCCAALLSDPRGNAVELAERGCGRLCQARALILKARATLDRKADDELSTLRGEHGVRLAARARKQQLALLPSKPAAILRTVARAKLAAAAAPAAELPPPAAAPPLAAAVAKPARLAAAVAAATAAAAVHKLATDGARITKKDLKAFVKDTVEKEEQALSTSGNAAVAATTQAHNTQMGYYADYWDRNGRYGQNWWCWDNPNWRGPFGDPCVEYAVGGDRNFWCDWDGAAAMNACPRSCGTCSYSQLRAEDKARGRDAHLLKERFAPQTLVTAPNDGGVPKADGPSEPVAVARDRGISGKVLTEVEELKDKLKEVLTVTAGMAHDTHAMRKNNKDLSSQEASADLNNFYDKVAATARPRAAKDEAKPNARTASWGIKDLMDWFDGEGAKVKGSPAAQHASLAAKKTKAERQLSASKAKDDLDGYWAIPQA
ncbi:hypothetical protein T484DRAFT_1779818 [Baffinella frigidus]|nr:hypothetical protein T484DRAFT_1779818 [Cryptophyta sp. CCMP2293]